MPNRRPKRRRRNRKVALPPFNLALNKFMALPPNLEQKYSDVVAQVYPLKADTAKLQEFCDRYLNLSGDPPFHFEAAVPWVLMQVIDYGKMATSSGNVGWFSQHELAFGVPVRWYRRENRKWVFVDWTMVFPFIFVDNPLSMSGGREIYGWSKAGIRIDSMASIFEPANARRLVSISLVTPGTSYGDPSETEQFLQIFQRRPFMSARSAVSDALTAIPRAIASTITAATSAFETAGAFLFSDADGNYESLQQTLTRLYGPQLNALMANSLSEPSSQRKPEQGLASSVVTFKQFRDVRSSTGACFQGMVGSKMTVERIVDGGSLFDPLLGDATGGIHINLLDSDLQPIVKNLGIHVSEDSTIGGKPASTVQPLWPFWLKMDLRYGLGDYQCWRTDTTAWSIGDRLKRVARRKIPYLTMGSGAAEEVGGPYHFPRITFRVMPLRARRNRLQKLVDSYLKNDFFEFRVAGKVKDESDDHTVACLIGINFEKMTSHSNPGREYSDREMAFAVPVVWWEKGHAGSKYPALIPLYTFAGTDWNTATLYEVYGELALKSEFVEPDDPWLADPANPTNRLLLTIKSELFPELRKSQEARELPVLEVFSAPGTAPSNASIPSYLERVGLSHLWSGDRFHTIALKQIVDAEDPALADYQALVGRRRKFTVAREGAPATGPLDPLSIKVYDYPAIKIVETLGLVPQKRNKGGQYPTYTLRPIDPFWISGAMSGDAGLEMCRRVGTDWQRNPTFSVK